jgi:ribonucleoside-diphosphate reductase alpha subunit
MQVQKRDGSYEEVSFDKVKRRIKLQTVDLSIDPIIIAQKVCSRIYNGVTTKELDELSSQICMSMVTDNLEYGTLGSRIIISNHHKNTLGTFTETMTLLYNNIDIHGKHTPIISEDVYNIVCKYSDLLNATVDYSRDYNFDYFAFKTLERAYLLKINRVPVERIQDIFMRISLGLHSDDIESAIVSYELMSCKFFTHATPTLFHCGTPRPALLSCFLLGMEDSITGIYKNLSDCAQISKWAGGIGLHISNIRSKDVLIRGTNGITGGIVPMLKVYNETMKYVNQCFTPDTKIYSITGYKRVDMVMSGEQLITIDGSYQTVNSISCNYKENCNILKFETDSTLEPVKCTGEHEIYVIKNTDHINGVDDIKKKLIKKEYQPEFISASQISIGDLVGYPIPSYVNIVSEYNDMSNDYMYMLGIIIDNGEIINGYCELNIPKSCKKLAKFVLTYLNIKSALQISDKQQPPNDLSNIFTKCKSNINNICSKLSLMDVTNQCVDNAILDNYDVIMDSDFKDTWCDYSKDYVPIEGNDIIDVNNLDNYEMTNIVFNISDSFDISLIFNGMEKYINPHLLHITESKIKSLLMGIISRLNISEGNVYNYTTTSYNIAHSIKYLLLRLRVLVECSEYEGVYTVVIPRHPNLHDILDDIDHECHTFFEHNNMLYTKITSVTNENYTGNVYDFNMVNNHNYTTELGVVHNSGKRNGSAAIYIEPHHPDIMEFLELRKNHGNEDDRARDLFLALWTSDLFMERVKNDEQWSLLDPDKCHGLNECYGENFRILYTEYETNGFAARTLPARDVWKAVVTSQIETGAPYIVFKDAANSKSNQQNYGVIKSSNLCAEILEYSDKDEYACCCLASIGLPMFIEDGVFNHDKLIDVCMTIVRNLNKVIDINYYPVKETERSNLLHRPLGIGIQGLADVFSILRMPFDSPEALQLNGEIFETIYYASVRASCELSKLDGPYQTFEGSPASEGRLQFDLWNVTPSDKYDWDSLKQDIINNGLRNSLLVALMPTASTSQILGNNECFEPYTSNIYVRRTMAGDFIVINKYLVKDLTDLGIWSSELKDKIVATNGSVQAIDEIPDDIKALYKTVWEIKQKVLIDMAVKRAPFVCQTQSMNLFFEEPTAKTLTNALFYGWERGLKTGIYYCRSKPKSQSQQFTIDPKLKDAMDKKIADKQRTYEEEVCESCSA